MTADETINSLEEALPRFRAIVERFSRLVGRIERFRDFGHGSPEKFLEIVRRAAIVRQLEACKAIIALCDAKQPSFAVCFLRPAYEEMLWMLYLAKHKELAAEVIIAMSQLATSDAFAAQTAYAGMSAMLEMGFSLPLLVQLIGMHGPRRAAAREIGAKLGWRKGSTAPTLTHIAQDVGKKAEYDFIYEGTSRFVHFSPQELYRRVWGDPTELVIGSNTFANYWGLFAVYWSLRIFLDTAIAVLPDISADGKGDEGELDDLLELAKGFAQVPILTPEELAWPEDFAG